jgi:two-component system, sensor histidine kinase LadS
MLNLFRSVALLLCFIQCPSVSAAQINYSTAYLLSSATDDITSPPVDVRYQASDRDLSLGYREEAIWIRLTVHPSDRALRNNDVDPTVRVGPYQLSEVVLFELIEGQWKKTTAGATAPRRKNNPCFDGQHCFSINPRAAGPVYIRIRTPTIMTLSLELVDLKTARSDSAARISGMSVAVTIASGLLLIAILFAVAERTALAYAFLFLQTSVFLTLTGSNGELAGWFPLISPATWFVVSLLATTARTAAIALLTHAVINNHGPNRFFIYMMWGVYGAQAVGMVLVLAGFSSLALQINLASLISLPAIGLFGVLTASHMPRVTRRVLGTSAVLFALLLLFVLINTVNVFSINNTPLFQGLADRKLSGLGFALFVLWFIVSESARKKLIGIKEKQKLELMIAESHQQAEAAKERGMLIDMLTHEIKNPLGTIRFAATTLWSQSEVAPTTKERFQRLMSSVNRINGLLVQVSLFNKIENMAGELDKEPLDIGRLLTDVTEDFDDADRFEVHVPSALSLTLNKPMFTVVLENLMVNAHKYSLTGTPIRVCADRLIPMNKTDGTTGENTMGNGLKVRVTNQLQPDAHPDLSMLFKPYYRHASVGQQPGMGLGLSLVKVAIEKLGGVIDAHIEGDFISFEVSLP